MHIMRRREDIRTPGDGLVVRLLDQSSGIARRAAPAAFTHPFGANAKVDRRPGSQPAVRDPWTGRIVDGYEC